MLYIVDLRECLIRYSSFSQLHVIYKQFPLKDIIASLLRPEIDYQEIIWHEMEQRLNEDLDMVDIDALDNFFELLAEDLDQFMTMTIGQKFDHTTFKILEWIDQSTVLLKSIEDGV